MNSITDIFGALTEPTVNKLPCLSESWMGPLQCDELLPARIAEGFCRIPLAGPLKMLELPFKVPSFYVNLHWHVRSDESTALKWFCAQVMTSLIDLQA